MSDEVREGVSLASIHRRPSREAPVDIFHVDCVQFVCGDLGVYVRGNRDKRFFSRIQPLSQEESKARLFL